MRPLVFGTRFCTRQVQAKHGSLSIDGGPRNEVATHNLVSALRGHFSLACFLLLSARTPPARLLASRPNKRTTTQNRTTAPPSCHSTLSTQTSGEASPGGHRIPHVSCGSSQVSTWNHDGSSTIYAEESHDRFDCFCPEPVQVRGGR